MPKSLLRIAILGLALVGPVEAEQKPAAAARVGDFHVCPMVTATVPHVGGPIATGSGDVLIEGKAAATVGSIAVCVAGGDSLSQGAATVFINGKPAARVGDLAAHGGTITEGARTVFIESGPVSEPSAEREDLPEPFEITLSAEREDLPKPFEITLSAERQDLPEPFEITLSVERQGLPEPIEITLSAERQGLPEPIEITLSAERQDLPEPIEITLSAERQDLPEPIKITLSAERQDLPEPFAVTLVAERELEVPDVTDMSLLEARREIEQFNLVPADRPLLGDAAEEGEQPGSVRETRPAKGTPVAARSRVTLVLYAEKVEDTPEPEDEPADVVADDVDCTAIPGARKQYDPVEERFFCACSDGWPVPTGGTCAEQVAEVDCSHISGAQKLYDPLSDRVFCVCPDGTPISSGSCPELFADVDCNRSPGSRRVFDGASGRMVCVCPDGTLVDEGVARCPEQQQPQPATTQDRCQQFNAQLQAAPNSTMATVIIRQAQQAGCDVPMGLIAAVNNWAQREREGDRQRQQQRQTELFSAIMGGMSAIIQQQQQHQSQGPTRSPTWTPGPAPTPATPPGTGSTAPPAGDCPEAQKQQVCSEWLVSYEASDGRVSCCGPNGKIDNDDCRKSYTECIPRKDCMRWETRCTGRR